MVWNILFPGKNYLRQDLLKSAEIVFLRQNVRN